MGALFTRRPGRGLLTTRGAAAATLSAAIAALALVSDADARSGSCVISADQMAMTATTQPPPLRFGIYPGGPAGSVNPTAPPRPEDAAKRLAAVQGLSGDGPFVVRLYSGWTGDARADDVSSWLDGEIRQYAGAGLQIELAVRYKPDHPDAQASPDAFAAYLRDIVRRYGALPGFTSLQVGNEANLPGAPGASDGAFPGAVQAIVKGVIAAKDQARRDGDDQVRVGFNWAYDERPVASSQFWDELGRAGGTAFGRAVDWVGLDSYPGTWSPQLSVSPLMPDRAARAVTDGLRSLRDCYMPMARIGRWATLHVAENGFPTGAGRDDAMQSQILEAMVRAVDAVRGTYGVSDYRWFDLRDSSTADPSVESHYGITRDDYSPKPAYRTYAELIRELGSAGSATWPTASASQTSRLARCVPSRVRLALGRLSGRRMSALRVTVGDRVVKTVRGGRVPRVVGLSVPFGRSTVGLRIAVRAAGRTRVHVLRRRLRVC